MKRNIALFGASLAAGALGAGGLIMTSVSSSAAPSNSFAGVAYDFPVTSTQSGWTTGAINDGAGGIIAKGSASKSATSAKVSGFQEPALKSAVISVTTTCVGGAPHVVITGGGAAGTYTKATTVSAATFLGSASALGSVTIAGHKSGGFTVGAYLNQSASGNINFVALTGANCAAATTPPPTTPPPSTTTKPTTPPPSSTTKPTTPPPSTTTKPTTPPPSTTTTPTTPPPSSPTSTSTPTEPPTPTPTTTTLPVTG